MEFLYRLNAIPRLQIQPGGDIRVSGGSKVVRDYLKRKWGRGSENETETEDFVVTVPAQDEAIVQCILKSQKEIVLRNLTDVEIPLSPPAVSMHELEDGLVCVLGKPSPATMIEMQQIGGEFRDNFLVGGDKRMGWIFKSDTMDQLQTLLSISSTHYSSPPMATEESHPEPFSTISPVVRRSERVGKVTKRSHAAMNEVPPVASAESAPLPKKSKTGGNKLRTR